MQPAKGYTALFLTEDSGFHGTEAIQAATTVCARCSVERECLDYAINHSSSSGTWAGTTTKQTIRIRTHRRHAAQQAS